MANVTHNVLVNQSSGKVGNGVYKTRGGKTFLSKLPDFSNRVLSDKQEDWNDRLREANIYARKVKLEDPELWAFYTKKSKQKNLTVHNVAVKDFMTLPKIKKIDISSYKGEVGDIVIIEARDIYQIKGAKVCIVGMDGIEIESGDAEEEKYSDFWNYTAKTLNPTWQEGRFIVTIQDTPGNKVVAILEKDPIFVPDSASQTDPDTFQGASQVVHWRMIEGPPRERRRKGGGKAEKRRRKSRQWWKFWRWF